MPAHAADRDLYLKRAVASLTSDPRFVAAWLGGSFGRGDQDEWSDLDLWAVVRDAAAGELCARSRGSAAGTIPARLDLISRVGEPGIIHEHHPNAPTGGSFTSCIYTNGVMIDWTLIPERIARRGQASTLLFDLVGVPVEAEAMPGSPEERAARASERYAFAWMMAVPASKAIRRDDGGRFHEALELMHAAIAEIEALLSGEALRYSRRSRAPFAMTPDARWSALRDLLGRLDQLAPAIVANGGSAPPDRRRALRSWMNLE